jgi:hypothetical protein
MNGSTLARILDGLEDSNVYQFGFSMKLMLSRYINRKRRIEFNRKRSEPEGLSEESADVSINMKVIEN